MTNKNDTIRHCFALDLKDDPELIQEYKNYHKLPNVWPEVLLSIKDSGIEELQIYLVGNRMFMIMEVSHTFSFDSKKHADLNNPKVVAWEELMWKFQQQLPWVKNHEKWVLMDQIFTL